MTNTTFSPDIFLVLADDARFLGFGYIGGRDDLTAETRADADSVVLAHAEAAGWTVEDLFAWANSKAGRWFADVAADGAGSEVLASKAAGWGLLDLPKAGA
jgi:hypothetical protein